MSGGAKERRGWTGGGRIVRLAAVLFVAGAVTGCDLDSILAVDLPGQVVAGDLDNPAMADALVVSVVSDLECSWSQYVAAAAHHGDEHMNASGNLWFRNWGQRRIEADDERFGQGTCSTNYAFYQPLQTARFQAEDVYQRLLAFEEVPELEAKLAVVRVHGAFALVALGEGFCEMSVPEEEGVPGPLMSPAEVLRLAEERFTEALTLAEQVGDDDVRNMALVGRARVRLHLEDFAGVLQDASRVSDGYLKVATRGTESSRRYNLNYERMNRRVDGINHATISDHFRHLTIGEDGWPARDEGTPDPRVRTYTEGLLGHNFVTEIWHVEGKHTARPDPVPIASHKEARLFMAEAHVRMGAVEEARGIINDRRVELGLPTFDLPATQDEMLRLVLEERARELFAEGGHRLNDMLRFRGTPQEIPFLGEPGSIHPDGLDTVGAAYGDATCFPLPTVERMGNPNIS